MLLLLIGVRRRLEELQPLRSHEAITERRILLDVHGDSVPKNLNYQKERAPKQDLYKRRHVKPEKLAAQAFYVQYSEPLPSKKTVNQVKESGKKRRKRDRIQKRIMKMSVMETFERYFFLYHVLLDIFHETVLSNLYCILSSWSFHFEQ